MVTVFAIFVILIACVFLYFGLTNRKKYYDFLDGSALGRDRMVIAIKTSNGTRSIYVNRRNAETWRNSGPAAFPGFRCRRPSFNYLLADGGYMEDGFLFDFFEATLYWGATEFILDAVGAGYVEYHGEDDAAETEVVKEGEDEAPPEEVTDVGPETLELIDEVPPDTVEEAPPESTEKTETPGPENEAVEETPPPESETTPEPDSAPEPIREPERTPTPDPPSSPADSSSEYSDGSNDPSTGSND